MKLPVAIIISLENQGRFARAQGKPTMAVEYPRLPASSPWSHDPVPNEESLGFDINEVPDLGDALPTTEASLGIAQSQPAEAAPSTKRSRRL